MGPSFLKWAGGKAKLGPTVAHLAPASINRYHEPFVGGGGVFFALRAAGRIESAALADSNGDLVGTYLTVRDDVEALIASVENLAKSYLGLGADDRPFFYYHVRDHWHPTSRITRAARFIFLNKTCYNGLYRVNKRGQFNVPHGRYANPSILDATRLRDASACLADVDLRTEDFEDACARAAPGDLVYLDPPYHPVSETARFTNYTKVEFGLDEQLRLRNAFDRLSERGVAALLSNSDHPAIEGLYGSCWYEKKVVKMGRSINSAPGKRGAVTELLISNLEHPRVSQPQSSSPK